ncbi:MAG: molybdopterin-dependent oxidoreductase [Myxococcales bacterium]|nr:molybdopterin-dependent oxidoreductase [Myxococcales bacterium]
MGSSRLSRRIFVRAAGELAAGAALVPWLACRVSRGGPSDSGIDGAATVDSAVDAEPMSPEPPEPSETLCRPFLTPVEEFFRQHGGRLQPGWELPALDEGHGLRILGLVERELSLDLAALEAEQRHAVRVVNTLLCITGYRGTAIWTGVPVRVLLERAGADLMRARQLVCRGADGYRAKLPVAVLQTAGTGHFEPLVAFHMAGQRLPQDLGFPFRLLAADRYGYQNIKWLESIEVLEAEPAADSEGQSHVVVPTPLLENPPTGGAVAAGRVELCGFALSGNSGIARVEVQVDGGPPQAAALHQLETILAEHPELEGCLQLTQPDLHAFPWAGVWRPWQLTLELAPGEHRLRIEVRDLEGQGGDRIDLVVVATA